MESGGEHGLCSPVQATTCSHLTPQALLNLAEPHFLLGKCEPRYKLHRVTGKTEGQECAQHLAECQVPERVLNVPITVFLLLLLFCLF